MSTLTPNVEPLVRWVVERESVRLRRESGAPPPWSEDPIFAGMRFCNVERERDAVSVWLRENWREPYRDHPDLWFLMVVARLGGNDPRILGEITPPIPWKRKSYLAEMDAKGLKVGVRGYRSWISAGAPMHEHLAHNLFDPLWSARDAVRPKPGDTLQAFAERLLAFDGMGTFLAGQVIADTKFGDALAEASDWWTFVVPGPGSRKGLNIVYGRDPETSWTDAAWLEAFALMRAELDPILAELGMKLSSQDVQNCLCELAKYERAKSTGKISRPFVIAESTPTENRHFRSGAESETLEAGPEVAPGRPKRTSSVPPWQGESTSASHAPGEGPESNSGPIPARAPHAIPELAAARDPAAPHRLYHDVETRSAISLKDHGAHRYAADPSTEILCLGFAVDDEPVQLWVPGEPVPTEFVEAASNSLWTVVAHNDQFEHAVARHILEPRHGFPAIPLQRRRCSMAMASAAALPASLAGAVAALGLPSTKDAAGARLMRRMSRLLPGGGYIEDAESLERLFRYCAADIEAERGLFGALPALSPAEHELWILDQTINERGFYVDGELLEAAHRVVTEAEQRMLAEFRDITGLSSPDQTKKLTAWLEEHGCEVADMKKATVSHASRRKGLSPEVRRVLELRRQLAHATKTETLLAWRMPDGRIKGTLRYHGAATGRWAGSGPQPQNLRRDGDRIAEKIGAILAGGESLASPIEAVADVSRSIIAAPPGHQLMIADLVGIESSNPRIRLRATVEARDVGRLRSHR